MTDSLKHVIQELTDEAEDLVASIPPVVSVRIIEVTPRWRSSLRWLDYDGRITLDRVIKGLGTHYIDIPVCISFPGDADHPDLRQAVEKAMFAIGNQIVEGGHRTIREDAEKGWQNLTLAAPWTKVAS